jgi:RimJ/RimL family protein N-acetyltransferase
MLEGLLVDLVPYDAAFCDLEYEWRNNASAFWGSGGDRTPETRARVAARLQQWAEARRRGDLTVPFGVRTKDGRRIGFVGITALHPAHRLALLGARIGEPEYWGGGYGTDALLLLVDYAFDGLDLRKVWLVTTSINVRAMRQMDKVGFALEGLQRGATYADGAWHDDLFYGMLRDEWPGRAALVEKLGLHARA